MEFGCSECLCIAIESHRPALLRSLLQQTSVVYRDIFWVPTPREWASSNSTYYSNAMIPVLHYIQPESDLLFVGRKDCGHMQIDVEICTPFGQLPKASAYILVSLPLMARWHSSDEFEAERILCQSGRFDYSEPQLFHMIIKGAFNLCEGPLTVIEGLMFRCEFEHSSKATDAASALFEQHSSLSHVVLCEFTSQIWSIEKMYGKLSRLFYWTCIYKYDYPNSSIKDFPFFANMPLFLSEFSRLLLSGVDIHQSMHYEMASDWGALVSITPLVIPNRQFMRSVHGIDLLSDWSRMGISPIQDSTIYENIALYFKFIIRNGLSFFYDEFDDSNPLFYTIIRSALAHENEALSIARRFCHQLLSLGYGRCELHPGDLPVRDERLKQTRLLMEFVLPFESDAIKLQLQSELQSLVDQFDAGPLTLQQLARIAIRRTVGGIHFEQLIRTLSSLLPPLVLKYVAEGELLDL